MQANLARVCGTYNYRELPTYVAVRRCEGLVMKHRSSHLGKLAAASGWS